MATTFPKEPLVAILGTTGTGKSDLAVDLALKFNGEVINADAMQMYKGLPIITNQLTPEDQKGVPHHLLGTVDPNEPTWNVEVFAREATRIINEVRRRGKLPIVVGGTHYYIHALLFEDSLISMKGANDDILKHRPQEENITQFPILDGPTDVMFKRLREVDPDTADRWHPEDRRKIRRSLEIFLTTGRRASDIYTEQKQTKALSIQTRRPWQSLMFWVYTEPEGLKERLNKRVDKMYKNGLMDEVKLLHESRRVRSEQGETVDLTRGVWQSIGYKQMESFLEAERNETSLNEADQLKLAGLEDIKTATRQYAKYQLRWIRHKTIPALKDYEAMDFLFLLDSSNADNFSASVIEPASRICLQFLNGHALAKPIEVSTTAREVLTAYDDDNSPPKTAFKVKTCDLCNVSLQSEDQWQKHIKGRRHYRAVRSKKWTALIPLVAEKQD
ncbi:putative tRNA isopentenyltransferase [Daldinia loculata]|uniref:putative tRNA isopentenyltransferase n=1 Tax=Daldinia loculata TaxID=103429 RepID=UPI0020C283B3|nr:putative tRNA isopentenyltransferase [Daldinia loculata]KAI1645544.1 putative tRNA isopentenyltransferase [Daldinia loculata]